MDPAAPSPPFGRAGRQINMPPRDPLLAGCAGGARRVGSSSASPSHPSRVDSRREPVPPPASEATPAASPELPEDILMMVLAVLEVPDLVRAGCVCTSWRSAYAALRSLGEHKKTQTPCLLYTSESAGEHVACLYSLVEKRVYRLTLPEPPLRHRFIIGSSLGFLVTVDDRSEMHLVNPITGQQVALPSVTTIEYVKPVFDDSGSVHEYEYPSHSARRAFFTPSIMARCELRERFQYKAFVFHDSTSTGGYIVVLIHRPYTHLSFARVGDDKWTLLEPHFDYQDCTYKDGLLYAASSMGEIHAFDLSAPGDVTMKIVTARDEGFDPDAVHIVQAPWGGLLLVSRLKEFEDPDKGADLQIPVTNTREIKLHRVLDDGAESLVELPGHALFLGLNDSLCLSAKDYPALKGNHAYFTDDQQYNQGRKGSRRDIGVVDLGNHGKEDLVSPQLWSNWPSPVWITPSLTVMKLPPNDRWLSGPMCGLPKIEEGTLRDLFATLGIPISIGPTGMLQCLKK